jgi:hypothetical protein
MHELLPQITGQQAMVAAIDREAFDRLSDLVRRVCGTDVRIGQASLQFKPGDPESAKALGACYEETLSLEHAIPQEVAEIIGLSSRAYQASPNQGMEPTP